MDRETRSAKDKDYSGIKDSGGGGGGKSYRPNFAVRRIKKWVNPARWDENKSEER
jgi:hypothetical protein